MSEFKKFVYFPMEKPKRIQPDSPVYIYAYTLAVQQQTGASFVQLRLVNRSERTVHSVFLSVTGFDDRGQHRYEVKFLPLPGCNAEPHSDFGEDHVLFLPEANVRSLEILVEDVLFDDGMIWRRQDSHELLTPEQAGWKSCSCGMMNPEEAETCAFCGKRNYSKFRKRNEGAKAAFLYTGSKTVEATEPKPFPTEPSEGLSSEESYTEPMEEFDPEIIDPAEESFPEPVAETKTKEPVSRFGPADMEELMEMLSPLNRTAWRAEEPAAETGAVPASALQQEEAEARPVYEEEKEEPAIAGRDMAFMQETNQLMEEMQRRIRAREQGQREFQPFDPSEKAENPDGEDKEQNAELAKENRGILFWSVMVILMVLLALGGFFGVLYSKGYFR
ncbi:MAG: hypothetical protein II272_00155 [Oscillospiraceae bacterium]|nr:hypothetical protein [Oscillospiraceae bacterium]